jgi:hypothetical protein
MEGDIEEHRIFEFLEEGIVEKSAQEKFVEYLRRNPDFAQPDEITRFLERQKETQNFGIYPASVDMVEIFAGIISISAQIPKQTVWQGIKRAHYEGVDLFDPDTQEILRQTISKETLDRISTAKSEQDMAHIALEIYTGLSPTQREACANWSNLYVQHH